MKARCAGRGIGQHVVGQQGVLVGDFLFSRSFQLMVEPGSLAGARDSVNASAVIAEGEVLQLITSNDTETSEQSYLEVIRGKTAALFAAACEVGAVIAERPKTEQDALARTGLNLGIAFPIDRRRPGLFGETGKPWGKTVGDDFREEQDHAAGDPRLPARRCPGARLWRHALQSARNRPTPISPPPSPP